jgi:pilus assembly protein CpaB
VRIIVLLVAALVVAGGAGFYLLKEMRTGAPVAEAAPAIAAPKTTDVFSAAVELPAGAILKPEHLGRLAVEDALVTPEMVVADAAGEAFLLGSVAIQQIARGAAVPRAAVVQPGDRGFLAAVLPQGKRAISIPISEVAGVSGLVLPGDRVDIILTYSLAGATIDAGRDVRASETVLGNIRVLALDQRLHHTTSAASEAQALAEAPPIARTATLQVTPREAEIVTLATSLGDLSLVLNSVHDGGEAAEEAQSARAAEPAARRMTLDSDVTSLLQRQPPGEDAGAAPLADRRLRIQIVRGTTAGAVELAEELVAAAPTAAEAADAPLE